MTRLRRAGARWRILVHNQDGSRSYDITSNPARPAEHAALARRMNLTADEDPMRITVLEDTEFDEIAVGRWLHAEQMNSGTWHITIGGVVIDVAADRDGRPKRVSVSGPGDYDDAVPGCEYRLYWTADTPGDD